MLYSFLNFAAQSPIIELHLSVVQREVDENRIKEVCFVVCDSGLKSCSINISHSLAICALCRSRAKEAINLFKANNPDLDVSTIHYRGNEIHDDIYKPLEPQIIENIELGVRSSIASHVRTDELKLLNKYWKKKYHEMMASSKKLFSFFFFLGDKSESTFIFFNGRFSCARPIVEAANLTKSKFVVFDSIQQIRPTIVTNAMLHNLNVAKNNAISTYLANFSEAELIAQNFMFKKRNKIIVNDKVYTLNQEQSYVSTSINFEKPILSIFTSSDDEYRYIGADWSEYRIVNQVESIIEISNSELINQFNIVVRMHPNQMYMPQAIKDRYNYLSSHTNVTILPPEDRTDSYELIDRSSVVINFCSTIGVEANYLRKPVIQIGPSSFCKLPVANYVSDVSEAINLILNHKFKVMPIRGSIIWFCYLSVFESFLPDFKVDKENGEWTYKGQMVRTNKLLRFISIFPKMWINHKKGNYDFLRNYKFYLQNILNNTYRVK